jgi:hypothetical protein
MEPAKLLADRRIPFVTGTVWSARGRNDEGGAGGCAPRGVGGGCGVGEGCGRGAGRGGGGVCGGCDAAGTAIASANTNHETHDTHEICFRVFRGFRSFAMNIRIILTFSFCPVAFFLV